MRNSQLLDNYLQNEEKKMILQQQKALESLEKSCKMKEELSQLRFTAKEREYFKEKNKEKAS